MTLRLRRLLYTISFILFFLTAPVLVLYTAGFRYDFRYNRVVETGSLVIRSNPEKADIYLDGQLYHQATPTIVNDLLPGKLELKVSKEGFHDWAQTLQISARVTAFEENIKLYPKNAPQTLIPGEIKDYWWNDKADKLVYLNSQNQLRFFNLLNKTDSLIFDLQKDALADLVWAPGNGAFLLTTAAGKRLNNFVIDPASGSQTNLNQIFGMRFTKLRWDENSSDALYGAAANGLYRLSLPLQTAKVIVAGPVTEFLIEKDRILLLEKGGRPGVAYVAARGFGDNATSRRILTLLGEGGGQFLKTNSGLIALYDQAGKRLDLIDPQQKYLLLSEPHTTLQNVSNIIFASGGDKMVYADGFAVYQENIHTPEEARRDLIIRYSSAIDNLNWADDESHVFYTNAGSLQIAELKSSTEPRVLKLVAGLAEVKKISYLPGLSAITYIDGAGLRYLSFSPPDARSPLLGD